MKTAIVSALVMYAIAAVISMGVALLVKGMFLTIRRLTQPK
jgi:hypothetical protein